MDIFIFTKLKLLIDLFIKLYIGKQAPTKFQILTYNFSRYAKNFKNVVPVGDISNENLRSLNHDLETFV